MAKSTSIVKSEPESAEIALPSYAGTLVGERSRAAANNRPRPRVKILQPMSNHDLKKEFGEGSVLLSPENTLLALPEEPFVAVPLFLFETYELHRDINDKRPGSLVLESTPLPASPLGRLAQAYDKKARVRKYDLEWTATAHHMLNAVLLIDAGLSAGHVAVATWKLRGGGARTGTTFAGMVARREDQGAWCWTNRFAFSSVMVEAAGHTWWTLRASNPPKGEEPFIAESRIEEVRAMNKALSDLHATDGIAVVVEEADEIPI